MPQSFQNNTLDRQELINQIEIKKTMLCVGLDSDLDKIPRHLLQFDDPIFEFNKQIIDATNQYCVAYKINTAFYECLGIEGWKSMQKTIEYIPNDCLIIADAKRGDIGNTSKMYAKAFFENLDVDALTLAPYMGEDSVTPFLEFKNKWVIVLGLTSNAGALDFQLQKLISNEYLFEEVITKVTKWGTEENTMFVVGATQSNLIQKIRKIIPNHFLLVPGVGAQGGKLDEVIKYGKNKDYGLLINSSRGIIYASDKEDFAQKAADKAKELSEEMAKYL